MNTYGYVGGNPLDYSDPYGLISLELIKRLYQSASWAMGLNAPLTNAAFSGKCPTEGTAALRLVSGGTTTAFSVALADAIIAGNSISGGLALPLLAAGIGGAEIGNGANDMSEALTGESLSDMLADAMSRGVFEPLFPDLPSYNGPYPKSNGSQCCANSCCNK